MSPCGAKVSSWGFAVEFRCCLEGSDPGFLQPRGSTGPHCDASQEKQFAEVILLPAGLRSQPWAAAWGRQGPGAAFLVVWPQSWDMHPEFLPFAAWLCRVQREDGRGVCSVLPPLLPGLAGSLGDLGSVPSLLQPPHLHQKPSPWCKVSLSLCMSVRTGSCKQTLRSHSLNQRMAFHLLQFLCALDPLLSLLLALWSCWSKLDLPRSADPGAVLGASSPLL